MLFITGLHYLRAAETSALFPYKAHPLIKRSGLVARNNLQNFNHGRHFF